MQRMKDNYESRASFYLTRRTPVIIRLDGKAFHTYTRGLEKPFDNDLVEDMNLTAQYLCKNIQGAQCAYVQSDEISILISDFTAINTQAWFDYNIQKMTSVSASLATAKFNQLRFLRSFKESKRLEDQNALLQHYYLPNLAMFDSRVFNIPKEEVSNYFLARQKDAVKNSIATVAQGLYSTKELHGKNQNEQQELIFQKGINWNDFEIGVKRGRFLEKENDFKFVNTPLTFTNENFKKYLDEI